MAVAHDAATESIRTVTTDPWTFSHTPVGTPRGVVVLINHGVADTDVISGVTYGGVAMARVRSDSDSTGEPGRSYIYFLGASVPTGMQTVSVDLTSASDLDLEIVCATQTAAGDLEVVDNDGVSGDADDPQVTLSYGGRTCISYVVLNSGRSVPDPGTVDDLGTMTRLADHDYGSFVAAVSRQTTPGTSDFTIGYVTSASDDVAMSAVAISEVVVAATTQFFPVIVGA